MEYADREGLDSQDRRDLLYLIRQMDRAFLEYASEEAKKKKPDPKPKGGKIGGK
jgi:hypothetical protein